MIQVSFFYKILNFKRKVDDDDGEDAGEDDDDLLGPSLLVLQPGWPQMNPSSVQLLRP